MKDVLGSHWEQAVLFIKNPNTNNENSIRDARTPQPGEIVLNTMTYRSSETVQRPEYFQRNTFHLYKGPNNV